MDVKALDQQVTEVERRIARAKEQLKSLKKMRLNLIRAKAEVLELQKPGDDLPF